MTRVGWLDASSGVSGDMLLGAFVDAGVPLEVLQDTIDTLRLSERIILRAEQVMRSGLGAMQVHVEVPASHHHRRLPDILALLEPLDDGVRAAASEVFELLASVEARVHRVTPEEVHFHEVGALDSIADIVGVVAARQWLQLDRIVCSPIAVGAGRVQTQHGSIPVPAPAVAELLVHGRVPALTGPAERELATPTGVALAVTMADRFDAMPPLTLDRVATGAGSWDPEGHANVLRLFVGESTEPPAASALGRRSQAVVLEANVDDLDPRLWPKVITALMEAGADDAWLTPIVMKKGRPAHTLSVLTAPALADSLGRVLMAHSSSIGFRQTSVDKLALPRQTTRVLVDGEPVRLKVAWLDGEVVNVSAEYVDVARVARVTGRPEKLVLAQATTAAHAAVGPTRWAGET